MSQDDPVVEFPDRHQRLTEERRRQAYERIESTAAEEHDHRRWEEQRKVSVVKTWIAIALGLNLMALATVCLSVLLEQLASPPAEIWIPGIDRCRSCC